MEVDIEYNFNNKIPVLEEMTKEEFGTRMLIGYNQAINGEVYDANEVFEELEKEI